MTVDDRRDTSGRLQMPMWGAIACLVVLYLGPAFIGVFRPQPDTYLDFVQEWLSARSYWAGAPVYLPQREAMFRLTGREVPALEERPWNAHPPVAVLAALPFGLIPDYRTAHLLWNLVTFVLFLLAVGIVLHELRVDLKWWSVFPAIVLVIADNPVISQIWHAQLNFPLFFLLVLAWVADRRDRPLLAGFAAGLATAFKLFPGLILIYFIARRAWRSTLVAVITAVAANGMALGLFGWEAFATYVHEVLPSLEVFRGSWGNASFTGYWTRICRAAGSSQVAPAVVGMFQAFVVVSIGLKALRAGDRDERDRAFALAVAGMPLASPIAWAYYFVLLALPLLLLWQRMACTWCRVLFFAAVVVLLLPEGLFPGLYNKYVPGSPDVAGLANHLPTPPDLGLCAVGLGIPTLALTTLFLLAAYAPLAPSAKPPVEPNGSDS